MTLEGKLTEADVESSGAVKEALKDIAKKSKSKTLFKDYRDAAHYMRTTKTIPVVKKIRAKDPKDVRYELVRSFKDIKDARDFISNADGFRCDDEEAMEKLNYLIWYVPEEYL